MPGQQSARAAPPDGHTTPIELTGIAGVATWLDVEPTTVSKWITRYATDHPTPPPDAVIRDGGRIVRGWLPEREQAWRDWDAGRPGQGAKGKPKPRKPKDA